MKDSFQSSNYSIINDSMFDLLYYNSQIMKKVIDDNDLSCSYKMQRFIKYWTYANLSSFYHSRKEYIDKLKDIFNPDKNLDGLKWYYDTYKTIPSYISDVKTTSNEYMEYLYDKILLCDLESIEYIYSCFITNMRKDMISRYITNYGKMRYYKKEEYNIYPQTIKELEYLYKVIPDTCFLRIEGENTLKLIQEDVAKIITLTRDRLVMIVEDYNDFLYDQIPTLKSCDGVFTFVKCIKLNISEWTKAIDLVISKNESLGLTEPYDFIKVVCEGRFMITDSKGVVNKIFIKNNDVKTIVAAMKHNNTKLVFFNNGMSLDYLCNL